MDSDSSHRILCSVIIKCTSLLGPTTLWKHWLHLSISRSMLCAPSNTDYDEWPDLVKCLRDGVRLWRGTHRDRYSQIKKYRGRSRQSWEEKQVVI